MLNMHTKQTKQWEVEEESLSLQEKSKRNCRECGTKIEESNLVNNKKSICVSCYYGLPF